MRVKTIFLYTFLALTVTPRGWGAGSGGAFRGPSSVFEPFLLPDPSIPGIEIHALLSAGKDEPHFDGYFLTGAPDGMAAWDNGDQTFTLLVNHEIPYLPSITIPSPLNLYFPSFVNQQRLLAHGGKGSHIGRWIINQPTHPEAPFQVISGEDFIREVYVWDKEAAAYVQSPAENLQVLCSADMAPTTAYFNRSTGKGTQNRLYCTGEELRPFDVATELAIRLGLSRKTVLSLIPDADYGRADGGRAFAIVVDGPDTGKAFELPALGNMLFENVVASPYEQDKTITILTDDAEPGQVYLYIGQKSAEGGLDIERAGLADGGLFGLVVVGKPDEAGVDSGDSIVFADFGAVHALDHDAIETAGDNLHVTRFFNPEDAVWNPANPNQFYFVTSGGPIPSRLWRITLSSITAPELGGTIEILLDGQQDERFRGFDNLTANARAQIFIQEDGGQLSRIWRYDPFNHSVNVLAAHNPLYFQDNGQPEFLTPSHESSGIIDAHNALGEGWFLLTSQAHVVGETEIEMLAEFEFDPPYYEEGQLLAMYIPPQLRLQILPTPSGFQLRFPTTTNMEYSVEISTNLRTWNPAGNPIPGTDSPATIPISPNNSHQQFFRVLQSPQIPDTSP